MTKSGQLVGAGAVLACIGAFGIWLAMGEHAHHHHVDEIPDDSASAPLRGTDWNGPITLSSTPAPTADPPAATPAPVPVPSGMPSEGVTPPPLDAIPQPTIAPPLDDQVASSQRARALEMLQNRIASLTKEADDLAAQGQNDQANAIRVRVERMKARVAALQDGGTQ